MMYKILFVQAKSFAWKHGPQLFLQLEFKHVKDVSGRPAFDIIMYIYNEQEAVQHARRTDDGLFYRISLHEWKNRLDGQVVSFPTRERYAVTIQKAYRGRLGRRKADQAREEYYRPGGRGYLAASNSFYAAAAASSAAHRAAKRVKRQG
jgi:hypothetical protein